MGTLYYGDNLDILRRYLKEGTVDLVYLDPPFNSAQNYNAFFQEKDGSAAASQIHAFEDTRHWDIETKKADDAVPDAKARGIAEAHHPSQQQSRRHGAGPVLRLRHDH
jgi:site-specific DNA-methyltransferase (adenine-specific)